MKKPFSLKIKTLKIKIIILFLIPATVLIYFAYDYVRVKSEDLHKAKRIEFIAKQTKRLTKLITNIQLERGLSAGYIVVEDKKKLLTKLQKQFLQTDKIVAKCKQNVSKNKKVIQKLLPKTSIQKIVPLSKRIFSLLAQRELIRNKVLNTNISFEEEINFYTSINSSAINLMTFLLLRLQEENPDSIALLNIEKAKEYAGLERACIYNQLLSTHYDSDCMQKVFYFNEEQAMHMQEFELYASPQSLALYRKNINQEVVKHLTKLRKSFFQEKLTAKDAQEWFSVATQYISILNKVSSEILHTYITNAKKNYTDASQALYLALFLLAVSIFATIYIIILLNKIFEKEQKQLDELRIAAYSFDSQEAIAITDIDEKIIKINKGFTDITGYDEEEVLGKTPRILRSGKHSNEFFTQMWRTIKQEGRWKGDIYNKRKNGEIFPERLSITAIKNDEGETTNYIAHFLDISDLKKAQEEAEHQANHDTLTGIANRKLLMEILQKELSKAKRHNLTHAFMFIDLDHFKSVNDTYGHHVGDLLIRYTADILRKSVRKEDFTARISGDEFAVLLLNLHKEDAHQVVTKIADKILYELSRDLNLENYHVTISSSIGIRIFPLHNDESVEDIIKDADAAMYRAKTEGKNRYILHS